MSQSLGEGGMILLSTYCCSLLPVVTVLAGDTLWFSRSRDRLLPSGYNKFNPSSLDPVLLDSTKKLFLCIFSHASIFPLVSLLITQSLQISIVPIWRLWQFKIKMALFPISKWWLFTKRSLQFGQHNFLMVTLKILVRNISHEKKNPQHIFEITFFLWVFQCY